MRLSTSIFTLLGLSGLITLGVILWSIPSWFLAWFGVFLLVVFGLFIVGLLLLSGLLGREKFLHLQGRRKVEAYNIIQDGLGQLFAIGPDGNIRSLTTNPSFHINGKASEPTQAELAMQALFFQAIGKGHVNQAQQSSLLMLPAPETIPDLLPILDKAQRVLIRAISGDGKTTLLQHIADRRQGSVIVLDSQSYPDKWPAKCKVVGTGSNHAAISVALDNLITLMVQRYKEIGEGIVKEGEHPKLTIIIDEWMAIVSECGNASDVIRRLLTESRKAAFSVFIASHSERVKSLGLDGRGDLRDGFLIVRIESENGQRQATYDYGRGERPCQLPGEYQALIASDAVFEIEAIAEPIVSDAETKDAEWIELVQSGTTKSEATWQVFNRAFGGSLAQRLNRLLASSSESM